MTLTFDLVISIAGLLAAILAPITAGVWCIVVVAYKAGGRIKRIEVNLAYAIKENEEQNGTIKRVDSRLHRIEARLNGVH